MTDDAIIQQLSKLRRPFSRLILSGGDPGQVPVTKLSGAPWWPRGVPRPTCVDGHLMAFIAQIRLDEVPGFDPRPTLISFHYCDQCTYDGKMPWGWEEDGRQRRYNVAVFSAADIKSVDGLGMVTESSVRPQSATSEPGMEVAGLEDIWKMFPETAVPGGAPDPDSLMHEESSKLGGWPSWVQHPTIPEDEVGNEMEFVGQLDMHSCPDSAWACGYAYLFVSQLDEDDPQAELVIQTT
ncbi:MAG: DUF1963 domain-containing protein [Planctomycetes bacterium]|nr:DUF1963 domain-containing protein [Planctomycetota bacterium]